jgi:membrane-associated phospholipid phosphatase
MESFFNNQILFGEGILNSIHLFIGGWFDIFMIIITKMGDEIFYTLFLPVLFWCYDKKNSIKIGIIFLISVTLNDMVKEIFKNPRPEPSNLMEGIRELCIQYRPSTPGFPSGHTQGSLSMWGAIMYLIRNRTVIILGLIMIILIPYSRMYLGVHFLGDIMGGYVLGFLTLAIVIPLILYMEKRYDAIGNILLIIAIIVIPFVLYNALPGRSIHNYMGVLSGFLLGALLGRDRIQFNPRNKALSNIIKVAVGLVGLFLIKEGVKLILPSIPVTGFFRYWLMGFWITFIAPWIFSRIALLSGETP